MSTKSKFFFDFIELYFSDFLSVKFLFILHFRFSSNFLGVNLNFFYFIIFFYFENINV